MAALQALWNSLGDVGHIAIYNMFGSLLSVLVLKIPGVGPWVKANILDVLLANLQHPPAPPAPPAV